MVRTPFPHSCKRSIYKVVGYCAQQIKITYVLFTPGNQKIMREGKTKGAQYHRIVTAYKELLTIVTNCQVLLHWVHSVIHMKVQAKAAGYSALSKARETVSRPFTSKSSLCMCCVIPTRDCAYLWTYNDLLLPLEDAITQNLIPALTGRRSCSTAERELLALPVSLGGLGLANPTTLSSPSETLTKPLVDLIQSQDTSQTVDRETVPGSKKSIRRLNRFRSTQLANSVLNRLTPELRRCVELWKNTFFSSIKENLEMLCA